MVDYVPAATSDSKVLVVYFSRSNNTELMAMEIAKHYNAKPARKILCVLRLCKRIEI